MKSQAQKHCSRLRWQCTAAFQRRGKLGWVTVTAMAWLDHTGIARAGCSTEECLVERAGSPPFSQSRCICWEIMMSVLSTNTTQIHWKGRENVSIDWRGKGSVCPALSPSMAISKRSDCSLLSCPEQGSTQPVFSLQPFPWRCLVATDCFLPSLWLGTSIF